MAQTVTLTSLDTPFQFARNSFEVRLFSKVIQGRDLFQDRVYTKIPPPKEVPSSSIGVIQEWYLTTVPEDFILPLFLHIPKERFSEFDRYHTVTASDERLSLISYHYYGTIDYLWVILLANDIINPFALEVGTILRIPSQEAIVNNWITPNEEF